MKDRSPKSGSELSREWNAIRFAILADAAELKIPEKMLPVTRSLLIALSDAFDQPVPVYAVYRQLRTFRLTHWPILHNLIENGDKSDIDPSALVASLERATEVLHQAHLSRDIDQADALEVQLEVLGQLL